ncbi:MAG: gephyrin-like molybdotransferase Glp [Spirochaetota bacterium]
MLNYEEALKIMLENIKILKEVEKPLLESAGQILAEDIYSPLDLPQWAISGPDGYAVKAADIKEASMRDPVILKILTTARAGRPTRCIVKPGTAIRIMTGSVIPYGADCVVRFEDTDEPDDKNGPNNNNPAHVKIYTKVNPGENIRLAGSGVMKDTLIVMKGTVIGPAQISALASVGITFVKVISRPVVAIISTGDELVNPGNLLTTGKTYNGNSAALASLVSHYGGIPKILGIARDNESDLICRFRKGMRADAIITSGGVSKGDYDLVRLIIAKLGKVIFSRIKMGPGAPVSFGLISKSAAGNGDAAIPVFSLAGPPAGCIVNFETLVRPALLKMRGIKDVAHPVVEATALDSPLQKMAMAFVKYSHLEKMQGTYRVKLNLGDQLGMLASIAAANSLTIIPEGSDVKAGDMIKVLPLDWRQDQPLI